ncbi:rac GTPase-activating protein 1 isoform X1 [Cygnus olor]|uniref:rac GTPase-activating protein 1 isoform X2 n=1 Tax=Cygnus atratus TaxID=8868 RepID=UPI0015D658AA|nr:rac GTPase-activating protein 1 isoform X2 [Cygnus atratus]XP_040395542.1 rac GTPase-activating protein 1 isoform X1 [Cygnus olor]XP_040395544.1 rac GTPase-activating protein 1 isoform X1 [Cygnus olor]XP_040395545.1 rac GTPase-activating protein 1 isoform X1 [Cygnus olor]XP_050571900.1 rac GTPase-activating protein 1 isoform X1 [Cygnus atratus]XP_050571901.1 rac GTPase-activating protein 1 isoform X1 [Cygnus atratus]XP_050571903.1 rac GTPase-activating protein 1 isoform X2 [Cygnus atratus]
MEAATLNLLRMFDQLVRQAEVLSEGNEYQFIQLAKNFDEYRRRLQKTEHELGRYKDLLMKTEAECSALGVKLKHARNQVDVEIKRRQKAEMDCEKLERQIQLIRELLMCDASGSIQLSEEQKSALAFLNRPQVSMGGSGNKRLSTIDESGSILSDISFDKTDDSLDWDSSMVKAVRLKRREKRRSSRQYVEGPPGPQKKIRSIGSTADQGNESIVAKTTVTVPSDGGPIEAISTIQTVPYSLRSQRKSGPLQPWNSESNLGNKQLESKSESNGSCTPQNNGGVRLHEFVSKTVIKPESCVPCGKRIKFGKISLKCRGCRVVAHPECRDRCPLPCIPTLTGTPVQIGEGTLMDYVPSAPPMIPSIIVHCVNEIEQRGLHEMGLYRVSGCDKTVRELKEKYLRSKNIPLLSKVDDIHAICSLLKDFLRSLKEPLLTFRLNKTFMEAAEILDEDNSIAAMYQAVGELPQANRETLAFLMLHLQRVAQSPDTKMDVTNLAKVFGPTIVAHAVPDPDAMTLLQDTKRQPKVVERLLLLPVEYWSQLMLVEQENIDPAHVIENTNAFSTPQTPDVKVSMLGPLTTPEQQLSKTPSSSSLSQKVRSTFSITTPKFGSKSKSTSQLGRQANFFASPMLK